MLEIFLFLLLAVLLCVGICWGTLYVVFLFNPDKQWRNRFIAVVRSAQRQLATEEKAARTADHSRAREEAALRERAITQALSRVPLRQIQRFRGIGPATVASLEAAGFHYPADLLKRTINVNGLGEKKIALVRGAAAALLNEVRQQFAEGRIPEAASLNRELARRRADYSRQDADRTIRIDALSMFLESVQDRVEIANRVRLSRYLPDPHRPKLLPGLKAEPMPDLDEALAEAESFLRSRSRRRPGPSSGHQAPMADPPAPRKPATSRPPPPEEQWRELTPGPDASAVRSKPLVHSRGWSASSTAEPATTETDRQWDVLRISIQIASAAARSRSDGSALKFPVILEHFQKRCRGDQALWNRVRSYCGHCIDSKIDAEGSLSRTRDIFRPEEIALLGHLLQDLLGGADEREPDAVRFRELVARATGLRIAAVSAAPRPPITAEVLEKHEDLRIPVPDSGIPGVESAHQKKAAESGPHRIDRVQSLSILGIEAGPPATPDVVRRRYHLLTEQYNPERVRTLGPEFVTMAERKRVEVRMAAEFLLGEHGGNLDEPAAPSPEQELRHNPDLDAFFGE